MFSSNQHIDDGNQAHFSPSTAIKNFVDMALQQTSFTESVLLDTLSLHPRLSQLFAEVNGKLTMMTLYEHTECVLSQYEQYFATFDLPQNLSHDVLRLALALHDIGKPIAYQTNRPQHECHLEVIASIRDILPVTDEDYELIRSLVMHDAVGLYLQNKITGVQALEYLEDMYANQHLDREAFFTVLLYYYQSDTAGYTTSAGSIGTLDRLYFEDPSSGRFVFHDREPRLLMTHDHEQQLGLLRFLFVESI